MSDAGESTRTGSGQSVTDFDTYCEGDVDPTLNKRINILIDADHNHLVYLDDKYTVQWSIVDPSKIHSEFGAVANRIADLETLSTVLLDQDDGPNKALRRLLAEAMGRLIADNSPSSANECLMRAEEFMKARSEERARRWYFQAALCAVAIAFILASILWIFRGQAAEIFGHGAFEILMGALFGAIGAFTAMLRRLRTANMDASAGKTLHRLDGAGRVSVGFIAGLFIAMAIKADIFLGITRTSEHAFALLLVACFAAGWSEKLMPSLISRLERSVVADSKESYHN